MNIIRTLGKVKVWQTRISGYISIINFVMLFYLYIIEEPIGVKWYYWVVFIASSIALVIFIDTKFIMPQAFGYTFSKNPGMQKLKVQTQTNSKKLDMILNHLGLEYKDDTSG